MDRDPFSYSGTELTALAGAHHYYEWILRSFSPYLGKRVLEVGSGVGTFAELLLSAAHPDHLILVEPAANLFPFLERRYGGDPRVTLVQGYLENVPPSVAVDSVVLVNVLEHIEHDEEFLRALRLRLADSGRLLLLVPAGPSLFGTLDEAFGHWRRYTKTTLTRVLDKAEFRITSLRYFNLTGCLTWFIAGRILRKRTLSPRGVQLYDRWVVPWLSALERVSAPPVGQSLVAIAEIARILPSK